MAVALGSLHGNAKLARTHGDLHRNLIQVDVEVVEVTTWSSSQRRDCRTMDSMDGASSNSNQISRRRGMESSAARCFFRRCQGQRLTEEDSVCDECASLALEVCAVRLFYIVMSDENEGLTTSRTHPRDAVPLGGVGLVEVVHRPFSL